MKAIGELSGMAIGLQFPGHLPATDPADIPDWARTVEDAGFDNFAVSDRLQWCTPEPLTTLAAAAAVTTRVGLLTSVLLAPLRSNPALFASTAATVDHIAGLGRLRLGLAPGARADDYAASALEFDHRGPLFDKWLGEVRRHWSESSTTGFLDPRPATDAGPPLLFGGSSAPTLRRVTTLGAGWIAGGMTPDQFADFAQRLATESARLNIPAPPHCAVSVMVSLGDERADTGIAAVGDYYCDLGEEIRTATTAATITSGAALRATLAQYRAAGADEAIITVNDPTPAHAYTVRDALQYP